MKNIYKIFAVMFFMLSINFAQEEKKVLVEVFTNAHCPVCPPAHNALDAYNQSENAGNINYIFYHMRYPYSDDPLYIASMSDSEARDLFYGPFTSTPRAFFDGMIQQNNYSSWAGILDSKAAGESPFRILLSGTLNGENINIKSEIFQSVNTSESNLVLHCIVVENVSFTGRNGITLHRNVMRKMLDSPSGESFSITLNETKTVEKSFIIDSGWNESELSVVVFVQNQVSKNIVQSETILYSELVLTSTEEDDEILPKEFLLEQNYPNPFNPTTKIKYSIAVLQTGHAPFVQLKIYDILGNEAAVLVNEEQSPGEYEIIFNAGEFNLSSGIYFYKLTAGEFSKTKKLLLIK